ncbi:structure-specific endonuclease subunit SLX4 isoform X2 [Nelusetta ayraudi]|uniref:structure-specific endonuclease subunit SLX4 isoform X2 n=1 Tax=Nelusetta ayraudi TaxID=303726 RepID=UPI003F7124B4
MDDSDQDFIDLCSKPLKRVRKKPAEGKNRPKAEQKSVSQASSREKRKANPKEDVGSGGSKCARTQTDHPDSGAAHEVVCLGAGGDAGGAQRAEKLVRAKDKVLQRMQQFKRAGPQKMALTGRTAAATTEENDCVALSVAVDKEASLSPGLHAGPEDSDEALALRMQQDLDREAAQAQMVDLEDGGLFFCHICGRDLTHMTPGGRSLHVNRCLDESEESAPAPPPPPPPAPGVPDCPICGKRFKSQKSRSAHLKRCSSDMGVAPAALLQAVQRQAEESQSVSAAGLAAAAGGTKRKGSSKTAQQARKKPRQKAEPLDEGTMVALAMSSSLLQQQKEAEQRATQAEVVSATPELKWRPDAGKGRGKKKKGAAPRPPPLLLIQDAEAALARLQERVSALLLRRRPPSPPTPTRSPSRLPGRSGAAPLWQKSSLLEGATMRLSDFYTPELADFITPWESTATDAASSSTTRSESSVPRGSEKTSVSEAGTTTTSSTVTSFISSSQTAVSSHSAPPAPQTGQTPVNSPMDQAEEVTHHGCTASFPEKVSAGLTSNLRLSGFIPEDPEEQVDLQASGFLPETHNRSDHHRHHHHSSGARTSQLGAGMGERQHTSVALSRLSSDLSSMVNNPQLSDVQLQVDNGDVYFAHSFMVYARCPLLAEMVHESGFGVQEDGMAAAQRVLLSDVPGRAVLALLQYLYTAQCSVPASLQPHVLELASRFDLKELEELCEQHPGGADNKAELSQEATDQAFVALLRTMWNAGDDDEEGGEETEERAAPTEGEGQEEEEEEETGDGPGVELAADEKVNEEELEEIYEFAATQRKKDNNNGNEEEEEEEEEQNGGDKGAERQPDSSLDGYSRLFSTSWGTFEDGDAGSVSTSPPESSQITKLPPESTSAARPSRPADSALLQSSGSVLNEPSLSPPSSLPVPGRSPGQGVRGQGAEPAEEPPLPLSVCRPPDRKMEPELIVLSDSSGEEVGEVEEVGAMEAVVLSCHSPSPPSPTCHSYTHIKPQLPPLGSEVSPDMAGCSPEVSWLVPSTPLQPHRRSVASGSVPTRTSSSSSSSGGGCRTQLFPSLPPPPVSSSPDLQASIQSNSLPVRRETASCRSRLDPDVAPRNGGSSSSSGSNSGSSSSSSRPVLEAPFSQSRRSLSEDTDTPLRPHLQPCSSTPLLYPEHREAPPPPLPPAASPLRRSSSGEWPTGSGGTEGAEPGSFHLSPLSNCSPSSSSPSSRGTAQSERSTGSEVVGDRGRAEGEAEPSFLMMDEPPMAFNDSWGLDGGGPGRFSLRLEDSGGSSRRQETPSSSSDFHRQAPPPGCCPASASPSRPSTSSPSPSSGSAAAPPETNSKTPPEEVGSSLLDSKLWDSWREEQEQEQEQEQEEEEEEEEEEALPLTQRVNPAAEPRTPAPSSSRRRRCHSLVPITPMPHYSDMDTPELKNKLTRFGVRPLPKRQMILKLKEIHQYTHQLTSSSDSEDEARRPPAQTAAFKEPRAPPVASPVKSNGAGEEAGEGAEPLSASQGSNTSSVAASEESERSNPEVGPSFSSDGDSDADVGVSASQAATRLQDRLQAVRDFILSDPELYSQILRYRPLVLSTFQARLKAAGIRLGAAKLADYLDSQCITFTTAKPGQAATGRRKPVRKAGTAGRSSKAGAAAVN